MEDCGILFVYSLVIFVFCTYVFSPVLCHSVCRGNVKTEPILWEGIALFSLLRFHAKSSPPAATALSILDFFTELSLMAPACQLGASPPGISLVG